jgi:hypothetical protein
MKCWGMSWKSETYQCWHPMTISIELADTVVPTPWSYFGQTPDAGCGEGGSLIQGNEDTVTIDIPTATDTSKVGATLKITLSFGQTLADLYFKMTLI